MNTVPSFRLSKLAVICVSALLTGCFIQPEKMADQERYYHAQHDLARIVKGQEKITRPISIHEAVARTLKYNLDHRLELAKLALKSGQLTKAKLALLPSVSSKLAYKWRNNRDQTFLQANNGSLDPPSDSSVTPRETVDTDIGLSWSILDFGLSYISAKDAANEVLIAQEQKRKVVHGLVQQVRMAYWKAYNAQKLLREVEVTRSQVNQSLRQAIAVQQKKLDSTEAQLQLQSTLIGQLKQLNGMRNQMYKAKQDLAKLMALPPGQDFVLSPPVADARLLPNLKVGLQEMDAVALVHRPEMLEADYKLRIAEYGPTKAVLNALPGVSFDFKYNHTNNRYKAKPDWQSLDVTGTWNLMKLVSSPNAYAIAKTQEEMDLLKRMAMTMTVLTQIRLSYLDYQKAKEDFVLDSRKNQISQKLYAFTVKRERAKASNKQQVITKKISALNSSMDQVMSYAKAQEALSNLYSSVGINLLPQGDLESLSLDALTRLVQEQDNYYQRNRFNELVRSEYTGLLSTVRVVKDNKPAEVSPFVCRQYKAGWGCKLKPKVVYKAEVKRARDQAKALSRLNHEDRMMNELLEENKAVGVDRKDPFECRRVKGVWGCRLRAKHEKPMAQADAKLPAMPKLTPMLEARNQAAPQTQPATKPTSQQAFRQGAAPQARTVTTQQAAATMQAQQQQASSASPSTPAAASAPKAERVATKAPEAPKRTLAVKQPRAAAPSVPTHTSKTLAEARTWATGHGQDPFDCQQDAAGAWSCAIKR